jgi:anaerobic magnesium-protoporphyrin IX monomethyl ester cyclase
VNDRKLRAIAALSLTSGFALVFLSLFFYWLNLPAQVTLSILIIYTVIQLRIATNLFERIYQSRRIDLPAWLSERFHPQGYNPQFVGCDVLLVRTPSAVLSAPDCGESLGLGYLASTLRDKGYKVQILDARLENWDVMQTTELILAYRPRALGINLNFQYLADSAGLLLRKVRERGYAGHITLGGLFASVAYQDLMERMHEIDTLVRFEGERSYAELLEHLDQPEVWPGIQGLVYRDESGAPVDNPLRPLIPDLNSVLNPARDLLPVALGLGGYAYVISSRGCNGACAYCVQQRSVSDPAGRRWRGRDPQLVADEVEQLVKDYDAHLISFVDDDFFGTPVNGKTHARRVAEAIIEKEIQPSILLSVQPRDVTQEDFLVLKRAGVDSVILAVDNFSQPVLDRYRKLTTVEQNLRSLEILKSLGIDAYLGIIMFDPWTTLEELTENFERMQSLPFLRPWQCLSRLETYHGSPITIELEKQNLLEQHGYSARYEYIDPKIQGVYNGIEIIMKIVHPCMSELDGFRWGNLNYSEADQSILQNFKSDLELINREFNRELLGGMCLEIIRRQQNSPEAVGGETLADEKMQAEAEKLNRNTIWEINKLRQEALSHAESAIEPALS